jgi:hypothetical protein
VCRVRTAQVTLPDWVGGEEHEIILSHDCLIDEVKVRELQRSSVAHIALLRVSLRVVIVKRVVRLCRQLGCTLHVVLTGVLVQQTIWKQIPALWDTTKDDYDLTLAGRCVRTLRRASLCS